jgi:hypothetical protein
MRVDDALPQLKLLLWGRRTAELTDEEAFALYEANRQWVDPSTMVERERQYFEALVARFGRGVFLG